MIKFEIIGLTQSLNGVHHYNLNQLRVGRDHGHLFIPQLLRNHIYFFEINSQNQLSLQSTSTFHIDGRQLKDRALLKKNNLITLQNGSIKLKIIDFKYNKPLKLKDYVNHQLDYLIQNEKELVEILSTMKS